MGASSDAAGARIQKGHGHMADRRSREDEYAETHKWLLKPPPPSKARILIESGPEVPLTPSLREAIEQLITEMQRSGVGMPELNCGAYVSCGNFSNE